ncbi:MAG: hypothetical protein DELT_01055 [Desulfovibrio sp.]
MKSCLQKTILSIRNLAAASQARLAPLRGPLTRPWLRLRNLAAASQARLAPLRGPLTRPWLRLRNLAAVSQARLAPAFKQLATGSKAPLAPSLLSIPVRLRLTGTAPSGLPSVGLRGRLAPPLNNSLLRATQRGRSPQGRKSARALPAKSLRVTICLLRRRNPPPYHSARRRRKRV